MEKTLNRLCLIKNNLKNIEKLSIIPFETPQSPEKALEIQKKSLENSLIFNGFYKKPFKERINQLSLMDQDLSIEHFETGGLSLARAELMVENCIGKVSIPLGLGLNFLINGKYYTIPMCIEEPSVVAAASSSAKFIAENGTGFQTLSTRSIMIGQMQVLDCDFVSARYKLEKLKEELLEKANKKLVNMVQRGGGVVDIKVKFLEDMETRMLIVEFHVNVCESMGANIVNTLLENMTPDVQSITQGRIGIRILSNLCTERRALAQFYIPVSKMKWKDYKGEVVAQRILEAYKFAQLDPYRATTHNKGIMNGIDAVALATGQDWRAIEASCHAYSYIKFKKYQPLSHFEILMDSNGQKLFHGILELPLAVGVKGGVLGSNNLYNNSLRLLDFPSAQVLSEIMVCVGLAQNFGALRALAIEGIQKGHMALHARNIAMAAGTPTYLVEEVVNYMKTFNRISLDCAKMYLEAHELFTNLRMNQNEKKHEIPLSTFFVKIKPQGILEPLVLHVAFDCWNEGPPLHYSIEQKSSKEGNVNISGIGDKIFGAHDFDWLNNLFQFLEKLKLQRKNEANIKSENSNTYKIKLLAILLNIISFNLAKVSPKFQQKALFLFQNILQESHSNNLFDIKELISNEEISLKYGLSLFCELYRIFQYTVKTLNTQDLLRKKILTEMNLIIESNFMCHDLWVDAKNKHNYDFECFLKLRKKHLSATLIFFSDITNWKFQIFEEKPISLLQEVGYLIEIISIVAHDLLKWKLQPEYNVFCYWKMQNKNSFKDEKEEYEDFMKEIKRIIQKKRENSKELKLLPLNGDFRELLEKAMGLLKEYYRFEEVDRLKAEILGGKL